MKILVTSILDLKKSQHSRLHQFIKYLSKKHDVTVVSINDWWKGSQDNLEAYSCEFNDMFERINYEYLTDKKISPIVQELLFRKRIKDLVKKEDFDTHLNYNTLLSGYEATKRIPTVYDMADDLGAMIRESPQILQLLRPLGGAFGEFMIKKNIEQAKKVTVTTETLKRRYDIPDSKCKVIPNGVDTYLFRNYGNTKEELGLNGFIIGYVGVLREWVDLEIVFRALKDLDKEIRMLVVGKEGRFKENMELAKRCGVSNRVTFTGMVSYSQVPKYISCMDICLLPFKNNAISQNALPLKLFEYMACEKPVISTRIKGVVEAVGSKVLYFLNKDDLVARIIDLYGNDELRQQMGSEGRKFVQENYSWTNICSEMEKTLSEVASTKIKYGFNE